MKKVLLPLIAAVALSASAQLPNNFNYQGVIDNANAKVVATFELVDAEGNVVYSEDQIVVTNQEGAFTAVIGTQDQEAWNAAWMFSAGAQAYTIKATVDGKEVNCPLQAVPYANVAATFVGYDEMNQDIAELVTENRNQATDIFDLKLRMENADMIGAVAQTAYDMADANGDAIADLQTTVSGIEADFIQLQEDLASTAATKEDIDAIYALLDNIDENGSMSAELIETLTTDVDDLKTTVSGIEADLIQLQEDLASGAATTEDVDAVKAEVEALQAEFAELADLNNPESILSVINAGMGDLQEQINTIVDDENGLIANVNLGLTQLSNVVNDQIAEINAKLDNIDENGTMSAELIENILERVQALEDVTDDIAGIQETLRGKANVDQVADLQDVVEQLNSAVTNFMTSFEEEYMTAIQQNFDNIDENTVKANEMIDNILERIDTLEESSTGDINELTATVENLKAEIAEVIDLNNPESILSQINTGLGQLQEMVDLLYNEEDGPVASLTTGFTQLTNVVTDLSDEVETYKTGLGEAEQSIIDLTEDNMSNKAAIADMKTWQANVGENLEMLTPVIDKLLEDNDTIMDGLTTTQGDVQELVESNRQNTTAIALIMAALKEAGLIEE